MTMSEVCDEIGVHITSAWRWKRGEPMGFDTATRLCKRFGFTMAEFESDKFPSNNEGALLKMQHETIARVTRRAGKK
jgi:hypothetical protein